MGVESSYTTLQPTVEATTTTILMGSSHQSRRSNESPESIPFMSFIFVSFPNDWIDAQRISRIILYYE